MNTTYTAIVTENFVLATVPYATEEVESDYGDSTQLDNAETIRIVVENENEAALVAWLLKSSDVIEFSELEIGESEREFQEDDDEADPCTDEDLMEGAHVPSRLGR